MAETSLITITDVQTYRKIDPKFNQDKFDAYVNAIQRKNLRGLLGDAMYYDFFENITDTNYVELLAGIVYTYNGESIQYYGLKPMLCLWWLALAAREGELYQSGYGAIQFNTNTQQQFEPAKKRESIATGYMEDAQRYANDAVQFITENSSDYPLYIGTGKTNQTEYLSFKL